jgi:hypothetical protein
VVGVPQIAWERERSYNPPLPAIFAAAKETADASNN